MTTKLPGHRQVEHEDPLDHAVAAFQNFLTQHWQMLAIGVLVIATAVIATGLIGRNRAATSGEAVDLWSRATRDAEQGDYGAALEVARTLEDRYGGTSSGKSAILIRAEALAGLGRQEEAAAAYREAADALSGDPMQLTAARRGLAVVLEDTDRPAEAAAIYESLAAEGTPAGARVFDLRAAARAYHVAGDTPKALALLDDLIERYEGSEERLVLDQVHLARVSKAEWTHAATP